MSGIWLTEVLKGNLERKYRDTKWLPEHCSLFMLASEQNGGNGDVPGCWEGDSSLHGERCKPRVPLSVGESFHLLFLAPSLLCILKRSWGVPYREKNSVTISSASPRFLDVKYPKLLLLCIVHFYTAFPPRRAGGCTWLTSLLLSSQLPCEVN